MYVTANTIGHDRAFLIHYLYVALGKGKNKMQCKMYRFLPHLPTLVLKLGFSDLITKPFINTTLACYITEKLAIWWCRCAVITLRIEFHQLNLVICTHIQTHTKNIQDHMQICTCAVVRPCLHATIRCCYSHISTIWVLTAKQSITFSCAFWS